MDTTVSPSKKQKSTRPNNKDDKSIRYKNNATTRTSNRRPAKPEGKQWQRPANEIVYVLTAR